MPARRCCLLFTGALTGNYGVLQGHCGALAGYYGVLTGDNGALKYAASELKEAHMVGHARPL